MPLAPYLYRYRPYDGSDPDAPSPVALIPPDDDSLPALDPTMQIADSSQTQSPIPPAPPSLNSASASLQLPTNGQSGANQIPLQPLNAPNGGSGGGSPSYSGLKQLAAAMPPPGAPSAVPASPAPSPAPAPAAPPPAALTTPSVPPSANAGLPPETQANLKALNDLKRPDVPVGNWAQRLGGALLAMTKLAPVANQIIHPKYSAQESAYQNTVGDIEGKLKAQEGAENIGALALQREANAQKLTEQGQALADVHKGQQQIDPAFAKENLPWLIPNSKGEYWIDKTAANTLTKPESGKKLTVAHPGDIVLDEDGKTLFTAPPKEDKPPKTLGDEYRVAAISAGVDPNKPPEEWTPAEATRVEQLVAQHKIAERPPKDDTNIGTWTLAEDATGKPILLNSKTGETKPAGDVQKSGTAAKKTADALKNTEPAQAALGYAQDYIKNGAFTGAGDEALQEKFFELAKPATGFRMSQPQMDMLQNSRSWMGSIQAKFRHATTGKWFSDEQRQQIVNTMNDLAQSKLRANAPPTNGRADPAGLRDHIPVNPQVPPPAQ